MIEFILNNETIRTEINPGVTLLDFVREHQQLKGTKIGCREGDCGACTVLIGNLDHDTKDISYHSITSCISPLGNAHGKHVVTVEGINLPKSLNTVQQAMADQYATQCGFCTPGFVVSLTGFAIEKKPETISSCHDAISGNICRCTGYKSIEKAGNVISEKLQQKDYSNKLTWLIEEGFIPSYFTDIPEKLLGLNPKIKALEGRVVANGTDLYVHNADKLAETQVQLISDREELSGINTDNGSCTIGANTTVTELLVNKEFNSFFPKLRAHLRLVSSEPIRNMGTVGGNFVNASPIGDMTIFFLALDAKITITSSANTERTIALRSFFKGYKKYDLREGELLKNITFDIPQNNEMFNFEKVSKRTHLDIATVNSAAKFSVKNDVIQQAHISIGGVAAIPTYLQKTSAFLVGKTIQSETIQAAAEVLQSEIAPISDVRGAADYKRLLARQLFFAHFIELFPEMVQLQNLTS